MTGKISRKREQEDLERVMKSSEFKAATEENRQKDDDREAALERFNRPDLLELIHAELDRTHKDDHQEKLLVFLCAVSGFLPNPKERISISLRGNSATGKTNLMNTVAKHIPSRFQVKLTRATASVLEDELSHARIIFCSELNLEREGGANKEIVETLKGLMEGGLSTYKKDARTGFKETLHSNQEQKAVIYSSTEAGVDKELGTRCLHIPVSSKRTKIRTVNDSTLKSLAGLVAPEDESSWIADGIENLNDELDVIFPHLQALQKSEDFFDDKNPRSQRDLKRLGALTKAIAWLHQEQRPYAELYGRPAIIGHPDDFLNAVLLGGPFFDLSYQEIDGRALELLEKLKERVGDARRIDLVSEGIADRKTLNSYANLLQDRGLIEIMEDESRKVIYRVLSGGKTYGKWVGEAGKIRGALMEFDLRGWEKKMMDSHAIPRQIPTQFYAISEVKELRVGKILGGYCATLPTRPPSHEKEPETAQSGQIPTLKFPPEKPSPETLSSDCEILPPEKAGRRTL